jgi:hypothetical protein
MILGEISNISSNKDVDLNISSRCTTTQKHYLESNEKGLLFHYSIPRYEFWSLCKIGRTQFKTVLHLIKLILALFL